MMKFKRGDIVKVLDGITTNGWTSKVGEISADRLFFNRVPVIFNNCAEKYFKEEDLELVTEEETSMKFKVGDKVKVSNSWDGHNGEIGEINECNKGYEFEYCVTFDGEYEESFRETELELMSEKDTYPSLKQEYRSLLEIQRELTVLEESMMRTVRHTRTEIARNCEELAELESKILDAAKQ